MIPTTGLGDLLRVWHQVGYREDLLAPLARMLDLGVAPEPVARPVPSLAVAGGAEPTTAIPRRRDVELPPAIDRDTVARSDTVAIPLAAAPPPRPTWASTTLRLAAAQAFTPPPVTPLFRPERERALLTAAGGRARAEGEVDIAVLAELRARGRMPRRMPRRAVVSVRGGVQLIVDRGEWMAPFSADVDHLIERLRTVAGESLAVASVLDVPPMVRMRGERKPAPWRAPPSGTAVVVVSDLGRAARRSSRLGPSQAWVMFLEHLQAAALDPIVIVPGVREHYREIDTVLRRTMLLGWDRSARVAELMQFRRTRRR